MGDLINKAANAAGGLTGIIASERKDIVLSAGRLVQAGIEWRFLKQLKGEWEALKQKGKIPREYESDECLEDSLCVMLAYIDKLSVESDILELLRKVFLVSITSNPADVDIAFHHQLLLIASSLCSGEAATLFALYQIGDTYYEGKSSGILGAQQIMEAVARQCELRHADLVLVQIRKLQDKGLVTPSAYAVKSGLYPGPQKSGLTGLGVELVEHILKYEKVKQDLD